MLDKKGMLSISRQCRLMGLSRHSFYYSPSISSHNVCLMGLIDKLFTEDPTRGTRRLRAALWSEYKRRAGRNRIRKLMLIMGITPIYPRKLLSKPNKHHKKYPYLLRGVSIVRPNQVWSIDITYIRLKHGFVYLTAVIDWYSRYVLSWRLSTSLETGFCVEALKDALEKYGKPEIFNSDQGSQFTSDEFTGILESHGIKISMDGRGRALDNVFVERLWRTVKYDNIFIRDYRTVKECREGLKSYFKFYNRRREHSSLDYMYPEQVYFGKKTVAKAA